VAEQITLSPTRIKRWVRCKKSYDWRYHQKLVKVSKSAPLTLGTVISDTLAGYYLDPPNERDQDSLNSVLTSSLLFRKPSTEDKKSSEAWQKAAKISQSLLSDYHERASKKDNFEVIKIEASQQIQLAPNIFLLAIPDANIIPPEELPLIFEHKARGRYRTGDFGIDYQSVASCMVSDALGTLYNVLEYTHGKYYRELIMRSQEELDYFRSVFINIGEDILSTPWEKMYPMPFKRCTCDYWELCNAEMQGLDVDDVISELYERTTRPKKEEPKEVTND